MIGNPPYMEARNKNFSENLKNELQNYIKCTYNKEDQRAFSRGADILLFFYELSFRLLAKKGINTFITENAWLATDYGKTFQSYLRHQISVKGIVDSDYKYFEGADINTIITFFQHKDMQEDCINFYHCHGSLAEHHCNLNNINDDTITVKRFMPNNILISSYKWSFLINLNDEFLSLLTLMEKRNDRSMAKKFTIGQGLNITKNNILTKPSIESVPYYVSSDGAKYTWDYSNFFINKSVVNKNRKPPLLILPRGIGTHFCCFNTIKGFSSSYVEFYSNSCSEDELLRLWLFCNSSLLWLLRECSGRTNLGGGMLKAEATDLNTLPPLF